MYLSLSWRKEIDDDDELLLLCIELINDIGIRWQLVHQFVLFSRQYELSTGEKVLSTYRSMISCKLPHEIIV
jgi:hypothetical protein